MTEVKKRILIVEDEKPMARALELKLNGEGFEAKAVYNGVEALEILGKEKFDLILLDLVMPKLDGFGVLEALEKQGNKIPVVVTTNLSQAGDEDKAKSLGAIDYFVKSNTTLKEIVEYVSKMLIK